MRIAIAILSCLLLLAACGGDSGDNKAQIEQLKKQYRELNGQLAEKSPTWLLKKNAVIPARGAWLRSKGTDAEAAAKQALDEVSAAADEVIQEENALKARIRDLKDEIKRLGGKL